MWKTQGLQQRVTALDDKYMGSHCDYIMGRTFDFPEIRLATVQVCVLSLGVCIIQLTIAAQPYLTTDEITSDH